MIVLDTNVLSEPMRPHPEPRVLSWLSANAGALWTSAVTIQEITYGVRRLKEETRRELLRRKFETALSDLIGPACWRSMRRPAGLPARSWRSARTTAFRSRFPMRKSQPSRS